MAGRWPAGTGCWPTSRPRWGAAGRCCRAGSGGAGPGWAWGGPARGAPGGATGGALGGAVVARARGYTVEWVAATRAAASVPFGAVSHLVAGAPGGWPDP